MHLKLLIDYLKLKFLNIADRKEPKMEIPTLIDNGTVIEGPRRPHTYSMDFGMAFVTEDNKQVAAITSCRDYLQDEIRTFLNDKTRVTDDGHPYNPKSGDPDIFMGRLRLLFNIQKSSLKKFAYALSVLNAFERAGNMELTIGEIVHMDKVTDNLILLRGSGEYMHNPHLLSLVTLTMRFCLYNAKFPIEDETSLFKNYGKINPGKDSHLMRDCYKMMHIVLKERSALFGGRTLEELFPVKIRYNFHSQGGIQQLCLANTANKPVNDQIMKIRKDMKI